MDNKKDNNPPQFQPNSSKELVVLRLFEKDNFSLFVYKKAERIVCALYLTSNLFSDSEPIKWQLREVGVGVISHVLSLTSNPTLKPEIVARINADFLKLLSLLDIAQSAGFVSKMNFSILKKELENILETLSFKIFPNNSRGVVDTLLDKDFFALPQNLFFPNNNQSAGGHSPALAEVLEVDRSQVAGLYDWADVRRLEEVYKRHDKGHIKDNKSFETGYSKIQKDLRHNQGHNINNNVVANERKLTILKLLKDKNNLTIRDFSLVIKGCSEKTIQRELLRLVKSGVLKKSGERRWSRYSLATS